MKLGARFQTPLYTLRMNSSEPSIFTKIINREIPADIVAETDRVIAIKDIAPRAPVHFLVIPKTPQYQNVAELAADDPLLMAEMVQMAQELAHEHSDGDFRFVFNTGKGAGQTVFHVHGHVLSGGLKEGSLAG